MNYWHDQARALGLTGKIAPHSLRHAFSHDLMNYYLEQGYPEKEALALTSMDLGHGVMVEAIILRLSMVEREKKMSKILLRLPKVMEKNRLKTSNYLSAYQAKQVS